MHCQSGNANDFGMTNDRPITWRYMAVKYRQNGPASLHAHAITK
jgi:hypothetical protein